MRTTTKPSYIVAAGQYKATIGNSIIEDAPIVREYEAKEQKIIKIVSNYFNINENDLKRNSRKEEVREKRQIAMFFLLKYTHLSQEKIGEIFNKERTTVIHSRKRILNLFETDKNLRNDILRIEKSIEESIISEQLNPIK
jgi:chromosomal replication initiation ATPase DnaA